MGGSAGWLSTFAESSRPAAAELAGPPPGPPWELGLLQQRQVRRSRKAMARTVQRGDPNEPS
jgi:hypothetical protein